MTNIAKISQAIDSIIAGFEELKNALQNEQHKPTTKGMNSITSDFDELSKLFMSEEWPVASHFSNICDPNSEAQKKDRALGIFDLFIEEDIAGKNFLDLGCGEGHCVKVATENSAKSSVGYDIEAHQYWTTIDQNTGYCTTDFEKVQSKAPYDVILIFDVIDHLINTKPVNFLVNARNLLKDDGRLYLRCHPFTSRTATHLFTTVNKAYPHLVFTPEELAKMIPEAKPIFNIGIKFPMVEYEEIITAAGFKIISRKEITQKVEPFFAKPAIANRIMKTLGSKNIPEYQMSLQFISYVLAKA